MKLVNEPTARLGYYKLLRYSHMETSAQFFQGKVVLITGAGSGIGRAAAKRLVAEGAKVALLGRTAKELRSLAKEISEMRGESLQILADVSVEAEMEKAVGKIRREWKRLDVVVANAGVNGLWAPLEEISAKEWDQTLAINLRGTFLAVRTSLPLLKLHGGAIIVIASVNGTRMFSNTGATAYSSSKAAQVAFARMIALELAPFHVRVNTICPGAIETSIDDNTRQKNLDKIRLPVKFPKGHIALTGGKPGTAEQVADLIAFLASDSASHITGTEVFIDGAESLLKG
jgi:NAD(P)-dependent dehydrogenase (short-subunit alcohol dehydrogenase family)